MPLYITEPIPKIVPKNNIEAGSISQIQNQLPINELADWLAGPIKGYKSPSKSKTWEEWVRKMLKIWKNYLDAIVPWPVPFPDIEEYKEVWYNGIQYAKDMFKVDGAAYAFSTWFINKEELQLEAGITEDWAQKFLNTIDNNKFLIKIKFVQKIQ